MEALAAQITEHARRCSLCSKRLGIKDWALLRVHTLFGHVLLPSPRLISCSCDGSRPRAISPLKGWLSGSGNELRYQAARLGSTFSYRQAATFNERTTLDGS